MLLAIAGAIAIACLSSALVNRSRRAPRCGVCGLEMEPEAETRLGNRGGTIFYRCPTCGRRVSVRD
jgi:hypothetical protein